jgi:hypothetical protein
MEHAAAQARIEIPPQLATMNGDRLGSGSQIPLAIAVRCN